MNKENEKSKALLRGTIIYAIGTFGTKILSFLIVPLYTYYIAPEALGDYDLLNTTISLLTPLITLQISDGAYAWMMRYKEKTTDYITATYKFVLCSTLISTAIILFINNFIHIDYVLYFLLLLVFGRWFQTLQKLLRGLKNQRLFAVSGVIYTAVFLLLNFIQVVMLKMGVDALFQSAIIANIIGIIIILLFEKRLRQIDLKLPVINIQKKMLQFSIPLIPNRLNWWVINSSDRYIVRFFLGSAANGIYAVSYKFPSLLQMIYNIFYEAWQDMAVADKDEDIGGFYTKIFRYYYKLSFTFLAFLIPFTKIFIRLVMSETYRSASSYISFLYLGTVFQAFSSFFGVGYLKNDKTSQAATTSVYGAIINAVVNILLIKFIGLHAASVSTFIGFFVMFLVRAFQTRDVMKIRINKVEFCALFFIAMIVTLAGVISTMKLDCILMIIGMIMFVGVNHSELKDLISVAIKKVRR